jgi:twitching motility protein PilT
MTEGQPIDSHIHLRHSPEIEKLLKAAIKAEASDLHLKVGMVPKMRIHSKLKSTTGKIMTEERIQELVFEIMNEDQKKFFLDNGAIDFAYQLGKMDRFRINVFRQRGFTSFAARHISGHIPPFETLHLPSIVESIAEHHEGLILVTGPTSCGKSTTIASMVDHINKTRACHIITIEDPIEFLHVDDKAIVSQREIGIDVPSYSDALRSLMRQDPDVVVIGEMRDQKTLTAAMRAAETGHLVLGTLHAANAAQAIQRVLDLFPQEERDLVRQTFALTCRSIISQVLLPGLKAGAKRIPAVEILLKNASAKKLISEEREAELSSLIINARSEGMIDFTESLRILVEEGWVSLSVARQYAPDKEKLDMALKGIRSTSSGIL